MKTEYGKRFSVIGFMTYINALIENGKPLPNRVIFQNCVYTPNFEESCNSMVYEYATTNPSGYPIRLWDAIYDEMSFIKRCDIHNYVILVPYGASDSVKREIAFVLNTVNRDDDIIDNTIKVEGNELRFAVSNNGFRFEIIAHVSDKVAEEVKGETTLHDIGIEYDICTNTWEVI